MASYEHVRAPTNTLGKQQQETQTRCPCPPNLLQLHKLCFLLTQQGGQLLARLADAENLSGAWGGTGREAEGCSRHDAGHSSTAECMEHCCLLCALVHCPSPAHRSCTCSMRSL